MWVLEWVWADCACGRNTKNCIQEGWLQQIYFINGFNLFQARPHSSPLSGPTPYSPWHFGVLPLWAGLLPAGFGHMIYWHIVTSGCFYNKVSTPVTSFLLYTQAVLGYQNMVSCPSFSGLQRERKTLWAISNEGCREKIDTSIPILHQQWLSLVLLFNSLRANIFCHHKKKWLSSQDHLVSRILKFICYSFQNKNQITVCLLSRPGLHLQILSL